MFLNKCLAATAAASMLPGRVISAELEIVDESNPLAVSLGYKHDAGEVDTKNFPKRSGEAGEIQYCFNCALYQGGTDDAWSACSIFQNKLVAGRGWCNAWVANS